MAKYGELHNILRLLIELHEPISIRAISIRRNINYKSAYHAIKNLEKEQVITTKRIGNTIACEFNPIVHPLTFQVEWERKEAFLKTQPVLNNRLNAIPNAIILLFGSYAKNTQIKHSDVDLLVISEKTSYTDLNLSGLPSKMHINRITFEEFIIMAKTREFSVVSEAMKHNIILTGIEEYYKINALIRRNG